MNVRALAAKLLRFKLMLLVMSLGMYIPALSQDNILTRQGGFAVGCNYWASHAGTHMWRDWKPEVVEKDFRLLSENGIKVLRVFPLWPDFQPIDQVYSGAGSKKYIGFGDEPLPATGPGSNGVSEEQLQHFQVMADLAQKYNLKLLVGLVTGWMSGQLYVPPALEGRNILTDPESLTWQQKFVTTFVSRFKNHPAIAGWDFGNECNVMENVRDYYQAFVWSAMIAGAIRSGDDTRPVVSGMHGLSAEDNASWRIVDQAALTDLLTIHPYSMFTPYAGQDPVTSIRTLMHPAAEGRLYADIGGKPCLTEETGVLGPNTATDQEKAGFARTGLFSSWAHDLHGMFWWCGFDQLHLEFSPYNYSAVEQELGLFRADMSPKPVLTEFRDFSSFIDKFQYKTLPPRKTEAVCIMTEGQDNWAAAYNSFILAKQAGFDIQFQKAEQELKDASLYLMPSVKGLDPIFKKSWYKILEKVKNGATLYISLDYAYMPTLTSPVGFEIKSNILRRGPLQFFSKAGGDSLNFETNSERRLDINPLKCKVIGKEADGNPAYLVSDYGKGKIWVLTFPLETNLATTTGAFDHGSPAWYRIYSDFATAAINDRILVQDNPYVGVTEHAVSQSEKIIVVINYDNLDGVCNFRLKPGWMISSALLGSVPAGSSFKMKANDGLVLVVKK
jgi:endo-1,4-beta-mannosidase